MKVLQLSYKIPFPQYDGGAYSVYHSALCMLHAGMQVKTLAMYTPKDPVDDGMFEDFKKRTAFESVWVDTNVKPLRALANLLKNESYFIERFYSKNFADRLTSVLSQTNFDFVILEHLYLCPYINLIRKFSKARVVLRAQNIEHELWENYGEKARNPFTRKFLDIATQRLKTFEKNIVKQLDGVIALTQHDAHFFTTASAGKIPVTVIAVGPLTLQEHSWEPSVFPPVFFHIGSMDWLPNRQGIDWFIDKVLPLVKKEIPEVKIHLAGKKMPTHYTGPEQKNLCVQGQVPSSLEFMRNKTVLIVPLLSGGGMRVKIIEAMSMGKTVIATSKGASGINCRHNQHILIADTEQEFAEQILRCLRSQELVNTLGQNAFQLVQEFYHPQILSQKTKAFCKSLVIEKKQVEAV